MNELPNVITKGQCFLYADDTAIVCTGNTLTEIKQNMATDLASATNWLKSHKLTLNLQKTKAMFFGSNHQLREIQENEMQCNEATIEIVSKYKYLGMILDKNLKFDQHVKYLHGKVYPKMKTLGRIRTQVGQGTALYLYNSLINPLFTFNDYVYASMSEKDKNKLQTLQNSCIRVCLQCHKQTPRKVLYHISGIEPLETQRQWNTAGMVYLGINQDSTPFINDLFSKVEKRAGVVLRSEIQEKLIVPKYKLNLWGNFKYRGAVTYNQIDGEIRLAKTFWTFKKRLKKEEIFKVW